MKISTVDELKEIIRANSDESLFLLGGGSNMLLTKDIQALVLFLDLKGISIESEDEDHVVIKAMAGENWHEFVLFCIENNYGGIENLSLIPGNIGTTPIQNIGAYGVELKDVFVCCEAIEIETLKHITFSKSDCSFGYRNSIFKNKLKGEIIITSVTLKLSKRNHELNMSYGTILEHLKSDGVKNPTIRDVSDAVIAIRNSKLPDPNILGNSGSFFKNPIINDSTFESFINLFPEAPYFEVSTKEFKIPAGWLIEQAGFKGLRKGEAGVHKNQALVLVNLGNASGSEIWDLAKVIQTSVKNKFGILLEPEVNIF